MKRKLFVGSAILLLLIIVGACGAKEDGEFVPAQPTKAAPEPTRVPAAEPTTVAPAHDRDFAGEEGYAQTEASKSAAGLPNEAVERMIIHTTWLTLIVEDVEVTLPQVLNMVEHMEGYIVHSSSHRTYEDRLAASVTLRVPAERLDEALNQLRAMAVKVDQEERSGEDVTDEYVDLDSRLTALQTTEQELLALLTEVRQSEGNAEEKANAILSIYDQLTVIRSEIERIQGRMQYLSQMSAMATITVELHPKEPEIEQPIVEEGFKPGTIFRDAARALVSVFESIVTGLIWIVTVILPIVAVIGLVFVAPIWFVLRRRRQRRRARKDITQD